jgi:hypothetical protein
MFRDLLRVRAACREGQPLRVVARERARRYAEAPILCAVSSALELSALWWSCRMAQRPDELMPPLRSTSNMLTRLRLTWMAS